MVSAIWIELNLNTLPLSKWHPHSRTASVPMEPIVLLWCALIPDGSCEDAARLFSKVPSEKMRQGAQTKILEISLKQKKKQFLRMVQHCNRLSSMAVAPPSLEILKIQLDELVVVVDPPVTRGQGPDYL